MVIRVDLVWVPFSLSVSPFLILCYEGHFLCPASICAPYQRGCSSLFFITDANLWQHNHSHSDVPHTSAALAFIGASSFRPSCHVQLTSFSDVLLIVSHFHHPNEFRWVFKLCVWHICLFSSSVRNYSLVSLYKRYKRHDENLKESGCVGLTGGSEWLWDWSKSNLMFWRTNIFYLLVYLTITIKYCIIGFHCWVTALI